MAKITKDQLAKLTLDDATRADLSALITDLDERESQISQLKKKNEDSDKVVSRNRELEDLSAKQKSELDLLNTKLASLAAPGKPAQAFTLEDLPLIKGFMEIFSDETTPPNP